MASGEGEPGAGTPILLTLDGLLGGLEAQADVLVPAGATLAGDLLRRLLEAHLGPQLLLVGLLGLRKTGNKGISSPITGEGRRTRAARMQTFATCSAMVLAFYS